MKFVGQRGDPVSITFSVFWIKLLRVLSPERDSKIPKNANVLNRPEKAQRFFSVDSHPASAPRHRLPPAPLVLPSLSPKKTIQISPHSREIQNCNIYLLPSLKCSLKMRWGETGPGRKNRYISCINNLENARPNISIYHGGCYVCGCDCEWLCVGQCGSECDDEIEILKH